MDTGGVNLERLNLVAKAVGAEMLLPLQRPLVALIAGGVVFALALSAKGEYAPFVVGAFAVSAVPAIGGLWREWPHKFYFAAFWLFAAAVAIFLIQGSEPLFERFNDAFLIALFGAYFVMAGRAVVQANLAVCAREQAIVDSCWERLAASRSFDDVTEFSTKDWLYGVQTYRLMQQDEFWAVLRQRKRIGQRLPSLKFYELRDVKLINLAPGERAVMVGKKTLQIFQMIQPAKLSG